MEQTGPQGGRVVSTPAQSTKDNRVTLSEQSFLSVCSHCNWFPHYFVSETNMFRESLDVDYSQVHPSLPVMGFDQRLL